MTERTKPCTRCGRLLHPLGYARHMAMHRDADALLERYSSKEPSATGKGGEGV